MDKADKANALPLNFVFICRIVGMCACIERKAPLFWVAFTLYRLRKIIYLGKNHGQGEKKQLCVLPSQMQMEVLQVLSLMFMSQATQTWNQALNKLLISYSFFFILYVLSHQDSHSQTCLSNSKCCFGLFFNVSEFFLIPEQKGYLKTSNIVKFTLLWQMQLMRRESRCAGPRPGE